MRDGEVLVDEIRLHYLEWPGAGPAVLCLHGITANAHAFARLAEVLIPERRVIAVDLRGRGGSDKPPDGYDIGTHVRDVAGLIEALDLDPVAVVGWSLGAKVALGLAATRPELVERVVAIDPPLETPAAIVEALRVFWTRLDRSYESVDAFLTTTRESWSYTPWSAYVERYLRADVEPSPDGGVRHCVRRDVPEAEMAAEDRYPTRSFLGAIRCPTLVLRAPLPLVREGDQVLSPADARDLVAALENGRLIEVDGTNHFSIVLNDSPEPFETIASFVGDAR
jgi:pimeloyl-ACP methyl ester carboxylesterase